VCSLICLVTERTIFLGGWECSCIRTIEKKFMSPLVCLVNGRMYILGGWDFCSSDAMSFSTWPSTNLYRARDVLASAASGNLQR
jgi:hypothetical protein